MPIILSMIVSIAITAIIILAFNFGPIGGGLTGCLVGAVCGMIAAVVFHDY